MATINEAQRPLAVEVEIWHNSKPEKIQKEKFTNPGLIDILKLLHHEQRMRVVAQALLKDELRNKARIVDPNEYRRRINSLAQKHGVSPTDVDEIIRPIARSLMQEMLSADISDKKKASKK